MRTAAAGLALGLALAPATALLPGRAEAEVVLPAPDPARAPDALCLAVQCTADRRRPSSVPGPVVNDENVLVGLDGTGQVSSVRLEQRLLLTGTGDYQVRERGPARSAVSLGDSDPPVTKLGTVVWQGFSPGSRALAARLTLDAGIEAPRLPLTVGLSFTLASGGPAPLGPGGQLPGPGALTVHLADVTGQPAVLPVPVDAPAGALAPTLDALLAGARREPTGRLPAAGSGLPRRVPGRAAGLGSGQRSVPLRLTATVDGPGGVLSGPGVSGPVATGTLPGGASVDLTLTVRAGGPLRLSVLATPALDRRSLLPPPDFPTWAAWARSHPGAGARRDALAVLVDAAATGARAAAYSPYLGADLPGKGSTHFLYTLAAAAPRADLPTPRRPHRGALALVGLAVALLGANATLLWRRA